MENVFFKVGMSIETNGGEKVTCIGVTPEFAITAPYVQDNGKVIIDTTKIMLYPIVADEDGDFSPIESISFNTAEKDVREEIDAE